MFIELHLIQNFAPSNLNRDDTNNPKDCEFGGVRRARISSQSLKRAIRHEPIFVKNTEAQPGQRTKWLTRSIVNVLKDAGKDPDEAQAVAVEFARYYAGKKGNMDSKNGLKTNVLLYLSQDEIDTIAGFALDNWDAVLVEATTDKPKTKMVQDLVNKEIIPRTKERTGAPDIALFGRMLADQPDLEIDAACQVAHAISTHRVAMEMDYYTAVDDLLQDEEAGAGMVGFTSYNSACFYRYSRIDWPQLVENFGWRDPEKGKSQHEKDEIRQANQGAVDFARRTVIGFLLAALNAIPSGKQNSFAAQNPTDLAMAVVRGDGYSWNLANAFELPIRPAYQVDGLVAPSIAALDGYWAQLVNFYDDADLRAIAVHTLRHTDQLNALADHRQEKLSAWVQTIQNALPQE